jgi:putative transposase
MKVHPSGYYAWKAEPVSPRAKDDRRLLGLLKHAWLESGGVYGYRKLTLDMRDLGESCGNHRVARLLKLEGLRSQTGYRRRPGVLGGKPAVVAPNHLQRQFSVAASPVHSSVPNFSRWWLGWKQGKSRIPRLTSWATMSTDQRGHA